MPDFPKSLVRGDPIPTDAATWNALLAAGWAFRQGQRPTRLGGGLPFGGVIEALALNDTGTDLAAYKPAAVTAAGGIDVTADGGPPWQRHPLLTLDVPAAATDFVAVTLEAIPAGAIGRVAIAGVCLCDVDSAAGATFASPQAGDTAALLGGSSGTVRVLHVPPSGGSQRRCVVYLGDQSEATAALGTRNTPDDVAYTATEQLSFLTKTGLKVEGGGPARSAYLLMAGNTQPGAVTADGVSGPGGAAGQLFGGTKYGRGTQTMAPAGGVGYYSRLCWAASSEADGKVSNYVGGGSSANALGGVYISENDSGAQVIGLGVTVGANFAAVTLHTSLTPASGGGSARGCVVSGDPYSDFGYGTTGGFACWDRAAQAFKVGMDTTLDPTASEVGIFFGGLLVGKYVGTPPPTPPVPPIPPPPSPPTTVSIAVVVQDLDGNPLESRQVSIPSATDTPQVTDASGEAILTGIPVATGTDTLTLAGSGETVSWYQDAEIGATSGGSGYTVPINTTLGDMTVVFTIADPAPTPTAGTLVGVSELDSSLLAGRDITLNGTTTETTDKTGTVTFTGVTPGASITTDIATPGSEAWTWAASWPGGSTSGAGTGATGITVVAGGTTTVTYTGTASPPVPPPPPPP